MLPFSLCLRVIDLNCLTLTMNETLTKSKNNIVVSPGNTSGIAQISQSILTKAVCVNVNGLYYNKLFGPFIQVNDPDQQH